MSFETAREIRNQLDNSNYSKKVIFAGRGEPTLTKDFVKIIEIFLENDPKYSVQLTTNGKRIDALKRFWNDPNFIVHYDLYMTDEDEAKSVEYAYREYKNFKFSWKPDNGLNFDELPIIKNKSKKITGTSSQEGMTNRAGFLGENTFSTISNKSCAKLVYNMYIDWNGNYNLCCDDWTPLILGNIFEENIEDFINYNENLNGYRKKHFCENSREGLPACQTCNRNAPVVGDDRDDYMNLIRMNEM